MVACPTFMIHMADEFLLHSSCPSDCHVKYVLSHSKQRSQIRILVRTILQCGILNRCPKIKNK